MTDTIDVIILEDDRYQQERILKGLPSEIAYVLVETSMALAQALREHPNVSFIYLDNFVPEYEGHDARPHFIENYELVRRRAPDAKIACISCSDEIIPFCNEHGIPIVKKAEVGQHSWLNPTRE